MKKLIAQSVPETSGGIINKALPAFIREEADRGLGYYFANLWKTIVILGGLALLMYLIWGAIDWLMSQGDKQKLENAKNKITHAILGLAILACVWTIWALAQYFLGLRAGSGSGYYGGGNGSTCDPEDQAQCKVVCQTNKGCTGSNCVPGKDEYNVPDCECAPGPGQRWVKVDNNPWGRCE